MKKLFRFLVSSKFILALALLINIALIVVLTTVLSRYAFWIVILLSTILAFVILIHSNDPLVYKTTWFVTIVFLPLYGSIFLFYLKASKTSRKKQQYWHNIIIRNNEKLQREILENDKLELTRPAQQTQAKYLENISNFPVCIYSLSTYFSDGREFFDDVLKEMAKATKFIYLEFFIIKSGKIWLEFEKLLIKKAAEGIEIKILYDDFASMDTFSGRYQKYLRRNGISVAPFNRLKPTLNRFLNYRDHRKIIVIDGEFAYTGGMNIGDEYANLVERFGYWKDASIKIKGDGVLSFVSLFSSAWEMATKEKIDIASRKNILEPDERASTERIQIFGTGPMSDLPIARDNYLKMIYNARKHLYIATPYLILDDDTENALCMAALSGVDVRILLPGVPDKKIVNLLIRSYYKKLMEAGVKLYHFNGFVHAKIVETDCETCCIGTINFDFRSLYLHFEDAVMLYNSPNVAIIHDDLLSNTEKSHRVTEDDLK